jgi:hypothetical protein
MRDIRADLTERLEAYRAEGEALRERLAELEQLHASVSQLLEQENAIHGDQGSLFQHPGHQNGAYESEIAKFVKRTLSKGPCDMADLKIAAAKQRVQFGKKSPGRVLHFLLMGMEKNGYVERDENERWEWKEEPET